MALAPPVPTAAAAVAAFPELQRLDLSAGRPLVLGDVASLTCTPSVTGLTGLLPSTSPADAAGVAVALASAPRLARLTLTGASALTGGALAAAVTVTSGRLTHLTIDGAFSLDDGGAAAAVRASPRLESVTLTAPPRPLWGAAVGGMPPPCHPLGDAVAAALGVSLRLTSVDLRGAPGLTPAGVAALAAAPRLAAVRLSGGAAACDAAVVALAAGAGCTLRRVEVSAQRAGVAPSPHALTCAAFASLAAHAASLTHLALRGVDWGFGCSSLERWATGCAGRKALPALVSLDVSRPAPPRRAAGGGGGPAPPPLNALDCGKLTSLTATGAWLGGPAVADALSRAAPTLTRFTAPAAGGLSAPALRALAGARLTHLDVRWCTDLEAASGDDWATGLRGSAASLATLSIGARPPRRRRARGGGV